MPRCARAVSITGYYHVFDRGNSKQIIFEDDSDRYRFLSDISDRFARHDVAVLAWCLMDNHFHLMVDDPFDNLSKAMQCALTAYAKYFNGKRGERDICLTIAIRGSQLSRTRRQCSCSTIFISIP